MRPPCSHRGAFQSMRFRLRHIVSLCRLRGRQGLYPANSRSRSTLFSPLFWARQWACLLSAGAGIFPFVRQCQCGVALAPLGMEFRIPFPSDRRKAVFRLQIAGAGGAPRLFFNNRWVHPRLQQFPCRVPLLPGFFQTDIRIFAKTKSFLLFFKTVRSPP